MALFGNEDLSWSHITGTSGSSNAGTTVIKIGPGGHLGGIYVGVPSTGTISYYDVASGTGTTAANLIMVVSNNGTKVPDLFTPNTSLKFGLTAVMSVGTTDQTVFYN